MASKRVEQVLNGIKNLSPQERAELVGFLSGESTRGGKTVIIEESLVKANTIRSAPVDQGGCACCGR